MLYYECTIIAGRVYFDPVVGGYPEEDVRAVGYRCDRIGEFTNKTDIFNSPIVWHDTPYFYLTGEELRLVEALDIVESPE